MTATVSSVFSTDSPSDAPKVHDNVNLYELLSSSSPLSKNTPILTAAFNSCYQKALLSLHDHLEAPDTHVPSATTTRLSSYNVSEEDFDATAFPTRSIKPSATTISQWRHEQLLNSKFLNLLLPLVAERMHSIVLNWHELELRNEEDRSGKNERKKQELKKKIDELNEMTKAIDVHRLYELSGSSKDVLIEQVDWKLVVTMMRKAGGFKYFDEHSLRRIWMHRGQYGVGNTWTDEEDETLHRLVHEHGEGAWMDIAQHELFQRRKKSAFMCAQRYMVAANRQHSKRRFTKPEKEYLQTMYKHRCAVVKDYRFCVSHAAYLLGDRCIREITHVWAYLNPDMHKSSFTADEDAALLQAAGQMSSICWSTLASSHLPGRSAVQCRQRYVQLTKAASTEKPKRSGEKIKTTRAANQLTWLQEQPVATQAFIAQFYSKSRFTQLQRSILELHAAKIESLMNYFESQPQEGTRCVPMRELALILNKPTVTAEQIHAKFVANNL